MFVWITDVHEPASYITLGGPTIGYINRQRPKFVADTGDIAGGGLASQFASYLADVKNRLLTALYAVPGNHDYYDTGDLTNYLAAGLEQHFVVDIGNFRLIGITTATHIPYDAQFDIEQSELDYIDAGLASAEGRTIIILAHTRPESVTNPGLQVWLTARGITHWWAGHAMAGCYEAMWGNIQVVVGGSLLSNGPDDTSGGLMLCWVYDDRIEIDFRHARDPFAAWSDSEAPAYTPITVYR